MRDGVRLAIELPAGGRTGPVFRFALCRPPCTNKDMQGPDMADVSLPCRLSRQRHAVVWPADQAGGHATLIANGYVHVIAQDARLGQSRGPYGDPKSGSYEVIDWISRQTGCETAMSAWSAIYGYAGEAQWRAARKGTRTLKAIFPYEACSAYGGMFGFRDSTRAAPHNFHISRQYFSTVHSTATSMATFRPERRELFAARHGEYRFQDVAPTSTTFFLTQRKERALNHVRSMVDSLGARWYSRSVGRRKLQEDQRSPLYGIGCLCLYYKTTLARRAELI